MVYFFQINNIYKKNKYALFRYSEKKHLELAIQYCTDGLEV